MAEYICTVSHDDPRPDGGFRKFIAGCTYDLENPCLRYFKPAQGEPPPIEATGLSPGEKSTGKGGKKK